MFNGRLQLDPREAQQEIGHQSRPCHAKGSLKAEFFAIMSAVEGMKSVPSVCVCLSVSTLMAELFDIQAQTIIKRARPHEPIQLLVGQRHRL